MIHINVIKCNGPNCTERADIADFLKPMPYHHLILRRKDSKALTLTKCAFDFCSFKCIHNFLDRFPEYDI